MNSEAFTYRLEQAADAAAIDALHADVFGPGRFARAAFRLREGVPADRRLSFVAECGQRLIASVRLTPITIGEKPALLLGPLAVTPAFNGRGAGKALVRKAVEAARQEGHGLILLVGDEPYYGPLGFTRLPPYAVTLPGPVDPGRVLIASLKPGAAIGLKGKAEPVR